MQRDGVIIPDNVDPKLIDVLFEAKARGTRLHLSFGHTTAKAAAGGASIREIGLDWLEEHRTQGYISLNSSSAKIRVLLLVNNRRSRGGDALSLECIVRVRESKGGRVLWQHPQYHHGEVVISPCGPAALGDHQVTRNGKVEIVLDSLEKARRWCEKMGLDFTERPSPEPAPALVRYLVPVSFEGSVEVLVPKDIPADRRKVLAEKLAVARILATVENVDAPEADACDEYEEQFGLDEEQAGKEWDAAQVTENVSGKWSGGLAVPADNRDE